jgi:hypothetical protein
MESPAVFLRHLGNVHWVAFCTLIHNFPQPGRQILIDAINRFYYLPLQIEPKSLETLRVTLESAAA